MQLLLTQSPHTSSLLDQNVFLISLISNNLSLCSSLRVRNENLYFCKTRGTAVGHYILIFIFSDIKLEDKRFWTEW